MTKKPDTKREDDAAFEKALKETRDSYPVIMQYLAGKNQKRQ